MSVSTRHKHKKNTNRPIRGRRNVSSATNRPDRIDGRPGTPNRRVRNGQIPPPQSGVKTTASRQTNGRKRPTAKSERRRSACRSVRWMTGLDDARFESTAWVTTETTDDRRRTTEVEEINITQPRNGCIPGRRRRRGACERINAKKLNGFLVMTHTRVDDATMRENIQRANRIK